MGEITPKKVVLFGLFFLLLIWLGVGNIFNSILHTINPAKLKAGKYEVILKYKHWGYRGSDEFFYHVVGKDGILTLKLFKDPKNYPNIKNIFSDCYSTTKEKKIYKELIGDFIVCEAPMKLLVFFESYDGDILIKSELNELLSDDFKKEYDIFLNGFKRAHN